MKISPPPPLHLIINDLCPLMNSLDVDPVIEAEAPPNPRERVLRYNRCILVKSVNNSTLSSSLTKGSGALVHFGLFSEQHT